MKKSKLFLAAGAFVLAATAVFATKANKKFSAVTTAYAQSGNWVIYDASNSILTTRGSLQVAVELVTTTVDHIVLLADALYTGTTTSTKKVFFK